jgi:hypothetical protein
MDRFERKGRNPGPNKNKRKPNNNQQKADNKPVVNQGDKRKRISEKPVDKPLENLAPTNTKPPKSKNFKKKPQPKRDDNA